MRPYYGDHPRDPQDAAKEEREDRDISPADEKRIAHARSLGWKDIHGGPPFGSYWRGTPPSGKGCEPIPTVINPVPEWQKLLGWFVAQCDGDSGMGASYWEQFPEYRRAVVLINETAVPAGGQPS